MFERQASLTAKDRLNASRNVAATEEKSKQICALLAYLVRACTVDRHPSVLTPVRSLCSA